MALYKVTVHPVGDVQHTVDTQGKDVMNGNVFCFACSLQDEQLRKNGYGLEPDGKGPYHFQDGVLVSQDQRSHKGSSGKVAHLEGVEVFLGCSLVFVGQDVDGVYRRADEKHLEK